MRPMREPCLLTPASGDTDANVRADYMYEWRTFKPDRGRIVIKLTAVLP